MPTFNFNARKNSHDLGREYGVSVSWTGTSNVVEFRSTGIPFHSYGNPVSEVTAQSQNYYITFLFRGGEDQPGTQDPLYNGVIGFWINGIAVVNPGSNDSIPRGFPNAPQGYTYNMGYTGTPSLGFNYNKDLAGGHVMNLANAPSGNTYHYCGYTFETAWTSGGGHIAGSTTSQGLAEVSVIPYLDGTMTHGDGHSKIIGIALDGYPIYGPYGYADPEDLNSGVTRLASGYTLKNSSSRSVKATDLAQWPMGIFVEDYEFTDAGDLDEFNGRYCITPDYPDGTYAYFVSTDTSNNAVYPYVIGPNFYGTPTRNSITIPTSVGAYPVWLTKAGDLGKISAQQYFDLELQAIDPTGNGDIEYSLVAGNLPKGLRLEATGFVAGNPELTSVLEGVPFSTNIDVDNVFTVRAKNTYDNSITDRTFKITVTGNFIPVITSVADPLGTYLDGTEVDLQLEAIDLNDDPLTWKLISGQLPPGLTLSSDGLISGVIIPKVYSYSPEVIGWSNSTWNNVSWDFETIANNAVYNFTVSVSDTKATVTKSYKIAVYAFNGLRADTMSITADSTTITADQYPDRPPILLTKDLGLYQTINSGGYFSFKFDGIDYDGTNILYIIDAGGSTGFGELFDEALWDSVSLTLPTGLSLDQNTGWLTGYIPKQAETTKDYTFSVQVQSATDNENISPQRLFTLTVLGNLDLAVNFTTPNDLGSVYVGATSNFSINAVAASGRELSYTLKQGGKCGKLPQGLQLLPDGTISGRVSFQCMGFDRGTTTFDQVLANKFIYDQPTRFDNQYEFTVVAESGDSEITQISGEKTFTMKVVPATYEPYENLYIRCLPGIEKRQILEQIIFNTDIFDPDDIYRPKDPYFGLQNEIKFLVSYGIKASKLSEYIAAMKDRHFRKKFYFGDYKLAQGKDVNGNVLYDVIYVDLIEDTKIYDNSSGIMVKKIPAAFTNINNKKGKWRNPRASYLDTNQLFADEARATAKSLEIKASDSWYAFEPLNVISPNDLTLMQRDIAKNLQNSYLNSLPEWMVSVQSDGKILGYTSGAVLAYLKPGTGAKALYNIKQYTRFNIKSVPFVSDRYVLNNSYTSNFDITTRRFIRHDYTTFDRSSKYGVSITPVYNVNFAVDTKFDEINGKTLTYIINNGGFNGVTYNLQDKYLIFATQEFVETINDGWNLYPGPVAVPGYTEKQLIPTIKNQRGGVWQINIDENDTVTLKFIKEISVGDYIYVRQGADYANSFQQYTDAVLTQGYSVPKYVTAYEDAYTGRPETTFDQSDTTFINNIDTYTIPLQNDKYLGFPKIGVFTNGQ